MDSLIVLACWIIWLERNDRIFHNRCKTQSQIVDLIVEHISLGAAARYQSVLVLGPSDVGRRSVQHVT
jgi:hypothetical protein